MDSSLPATSRLSSHRQQGCAVLPVSAVIANKPIRAWGHHLTPAAYTGIVGAAVSISRNVALFREYNPGGIERSGGVGVLYSFPRERESGDQADPRDKAGSPSSQVLQSGTFR